MRKSTILRTALLIVAVMALGSCTWFISVFNHMDVDGERYPLDKMTVVYWGTDGSVHEHFIYLMSEGLSYSAENGMNGDGEFIILDLIGPSRSLSDGDYNYSQSLASETLYGG
ncbi:MAG: hypothetical protein ACOC37_03000, partial [Spirochaetota bacterium]